MLTLFGNKVPSSSLPEYNIDLSAYFDEDEVSSIRLQGKETTLSPDQLRIQNAKFIGDVFAEIQGLLPPNILEPFSEFSSIEFDAPRIQRAQTNLSKQSHLRE